MAAHPDDRDSRSPDAATDAWSPQTTPLSGAQIDEIVGAIEGHKRNRSLSNRIDRSALGEALNDLLMARGLAGVFDEDPDGLFLSGRQTGADRLMQEAFLREVFQDIGTRTRSLIRLLGSDGRDQYIREVVPGISLDIPPNAATLSVTRRILDAMHEQFRVLESGSSTDTQGTGDPFAGHMSPILDTLAVVLKHLRSSTVTPQLNASLRQELTRTGDMAPDASQRDGRVVDVNFDVFMTHLKAVAASVDAIARYHDSLVVTNRPNDDFLDGILLDLADIYLIATSSNRPRSSLTAGIKGPFVGFCLDVLRHYFPEEYVSIGAVAKRWQRLKRAEY